VGHCLAMAFTSIPFVVEPFQPVLEELYRRGGSRHWNASCFRLVCIFVAWIFPALWPALMNRQLLVIHLAVLGNFGAIIFIAGQTCIRQVRLPLWWFSVSLQEFRLPCASRHCVGCVLIGRRLSSCSPSEHLARPRLFYVAFTGRS